MSQILEIKIFINKIKNTVDRLGSRIDQAEARITECKHRSFQITNSNKEKEKIPIK